MNVPLIMVLGGQMAPHRNQNHSALPATQVASWRWRVGWAIPEPCRNDFHQTYRFTHKDISFSLCSWI